MDNYKMLIGGEWVEGAGKIEVINPATEKAFATVEKGTKENVDAAVAAAKAAFPAWSQTPIEERQAKLAELSAAVAKNAEKLARLLTQEQGKPLAEAMGEMAWTEGYLGHFATLKVENRVIQDDEDFFIEMRRKPLGVVAGILPWNFPVLVACWKIAPALIAGNTIVLKPAPTTPVATLALGEICSEIFPPGVVNIITDENDLGPYLTTHPDVAKVGFTGSTATGKKIMASASDTLKRLTLELGGNDAGIVLDDVNVPETAQKIFDAAFLNCGQVCLAIKRAYVHDSIYDEMCAELSKIAENTVTDDGLKQGTNIGPIQNREQYEKVKGFLDDVRAAGKIAAGGQVEDREGFFIRPTIVRDVKEGDDIVDKEQFGPVLPLIRFTDIDDVVARANASEYGLGGSVWSSDVKRATDVAERIESGSVWVNQHINIGPHIPMAGFKQSGIGVEQSLEGLDEYTQVQVLNVAKR
ncbi:MAG: aldehyde dehydrogenase family protein [Alphaproteobacteria bacterium]|nr:MAG: aldehyde dehydrogenase family protein [Alphaproteobacteria bacterium]